MAIGISEEHVELGRVARRWAERHCPPAAVRAVLDADAEPLPACWDALVETGWLGLAVPDAAGGSGYGLGELVVVVEELGRAATPGPFLPSALAALLVAPDAPDLACSLVTGERIGAIALGRADLALVDGRVRGTVPALASGAHADVVVAPTADGWVALEVDRGAAESLPSLDPTRRVARVVVDAPARVLGMADDRVRALGAVVLAAEAVGISQWCVEQAAAYARDREQFGRPIGQFQAVKHRCAEMLVRTEATRAAVWDAARALDDVDADPGGVAVAVATAAALAGPAVLRTAQDCVQTFGGIGFTWEHDAHIYLRRATVLHRLLGPAARWRRSAAASGLAGARRRLTVELPPEAEAHRAEIRDAVAAAAAVDEPERRALLAAAGLVAPAWPRPWGRDAGPLEQLVIEDELREAGLRAPHLQVGAWALPTIIVHGTPEQQERYIGPTLRGERTWCQLFSEPGAGSDLAALTTRAERVEGGWRLTGQKVWTSMAGEADWGICLARSDPDAPKHDGITCFVVDMGAGGLDIRPLRELTGLAMFNEVFLDGVLVPDDAVVGAVHDGWRAARTTLANERVSMGGGNTIKGLAGVFHLVRDRDLGADPDVLDTVGDLVVTAHALAVLGHRLTLRALVGADPEGSEASVRKLLGTRHDQQVGEVGLGLLGDDGLVDRGDGAAWIHQYLFNQCLTIAGGTSDIQRNVIAERLLGLPKDP